MRHLPISVFGVVAVVLLLAACPTSPPRNEPAPDAGTDVEPDAGTPVDPCTVDNGGCDPLTSCTSNGEAVSCGACPSGYSGTGDTQCENIDECAAEPPPCSASDLRTCVDAPGTYSCNCQSGYAEDAGGQCADVDECASPETCDRLTECSNTVGGYSCSECPDGYLGSGHTACVVPPARLTLDMMPPMRTLSLCTTAPVEIPVSYGVLPDDPHVEANTVELEVSIAGFDGAAPIITISNTGWAYEVERSPDQRYILVRGQYPDIQLALQSLDAHSRTTGTALLSIRYCSPMTPSCSEMRVRFLFDNGEAIVTSPCDPAPTLTPESDTGHAVGDDITRDFTPTFTVQSTPSTTLQWLRDGVVKGEAEVSAEGVATFTDALEGDVPSPGRHAYSVIHSGGTIRSGAAYVFFESD